MYCREVKKRHNDDPGHDRGGRQLLQGQHWQRRFEPSRTPHVGLALSLESGVENGESKDVCVHGCENEIADSPGPSLQEGECHDGGKDKPRLITSAQLTVGCRHGTWVGKVFDLAYSTSSADATITPKRNATGKCPCTTIGPTFIIITASSPPFLSTLGND